MPTESAVGVAPVPTIIADLQQKWTDHFAMEVVYSLLPESFSLDSSPATVCIEATRTKNRKLATLPLRENMLAELREWIRGKPAGNVLFRIRGKKMKEVLGPDLLAAGIEPEVGGRVANFHALRMSFITLLSLGGVPLAVAALLARHSDSKLTLRVYPSLNLLELQQAVERLPHKRKAYGRVEKCG